LVLVWHRRAGKDTTSLNIMIDRMLQRPGSYYHLFPTARQGRKAIYEGIGKEGHAFMDHFPKQIIARKNDQEMLVEVKGEKGHSIYQVVGTDKGMDYLRGTNPVGVIFSEYSRMSPAVWDTIRPILRENDGWAIFAYTPWGENHGYELYNMAKDNDEWFASFLTVDDSTDHKGKRLITDTDVEEERNSGMSKEMVAQEFYCSFQSALPGAYFASEMESALEQGRITQVAYEPELPVETYWDLGLADSNSIWFAQHVGNETRLIDYYENSGEGLMHYIHVLRNKEYVYSRHHAPHDIEVREFSTGRSRRDTALNLGIDFIVGKKIDKMESIDALRRFLGRCWFDQDKCTLGIAALRNYHKAFNDKTRTFSSPVHDWSSHGVDALMECSNSFYADGFDQDHKRPEQTQTDYDIFNWGKKMLF
jgi:phage terminase large subunit